MFNALLLTQQDKITHATVTQINDDQLPAGNVTVAVNYSSLNYKDGLAITGKGKIIREFPMFRGLILQAQSWNQPMRVIKSVMPWF